MALPGPSRRIAPLCFSCWSNSIPIRGRRLQQRFLTQSSTRQADNDPTKKDESSSSANPFLDEFQKNNPAGGQAPRQQAPQAGDLSVSSIFEDDRRIQKQAQRQAAAEEGQDATAPGTYARDPQNMLRVLDPDPDSRERWQRKKVIQMVRRGGRLTKEQFIKRTEREHLAKSHNMKTSTKKLGMLARQIAGKNIDDAITQMRFSKKKVASDVMKQLEFARDEAVVMRGMGLGQVDVENDAPATSSLSGAVKKSDDAVEIQLKDGKRHLVSDRSKIYIDQAWVGRGPYGSLPDYRARGQIYLMRTPHTSISLLLKEEATRVREYQQREEKRRRKRLQKVWVPLPDRPITTQRQWYSW